MDKYGGYLGILKWSLAQSDGTTPTEGFSEMKQEDKSFLMAAMEEYLVDEGKLMKDCVKVIKLRPVATGAPASGAAAGADDGAVSAAGAPPLSPLQAPIDPSTALVVPSDKGTPAALAEAAAAKPAAVTVAVGAAAGGAAQAAAGAGAGAGADAGAGAGDASSGAFAAVAAKDDEAVEEAKRAALAGDAKSLLEAQIDALARLHDLVLSIDRAKDLQHIGGLTAVIDTLRRDNNTLQWRAADVLATAAQNNPFIQAASLKYGAVPPLLHLLDPDTPRSDPQVRVKALTALSALVREAPIVAAEFISGGGMTMLVRLLNGDAAAATAAAAVGAAEAGGDDGTGAGAGGGAASSAAGSGAGDGGGDGDTDDSEDRARVERNQARRLRRKAAFFLMHMTAPTTHGFSGHRDAAVAAGVVPAAVRAIRAAPDDVELLENSVRVLSAVASGDDDGVAARVEALCTPVATSGELAGVSGASVLRETAAEYESHTGEDREYEEEIRTALTDTVARLPAARRRIEIS